MTEYAFPKDLLSGIRTRWQSAADPQFELPEDRLLQQLLETCYHASLRTSEQRAVHCVVGYITQADSGGCIVSGESCCGLDGFRTCPLVASHSPPTDGDRLRSKAWRTSHLGFLRIRPCLGATFRGRSTRPSRSTVRFPTALSDNHH